MKPARLFASREELIDTYGHLDVSDLREAMETLGEATGIHPDALEAETIARTELLARVQMGSKRSRRPKKEGPGPLRFMRKAGPL